jgi:hypothetical protein
MSYEVPQYKLEKLKEDEKRHLIKDLWEAFMFISGCLIVILYTLYLFMVAIS